MPLESPVVVNVGEETEGSVATLDYSALGQCLNGTAEVLAGLDLQGFPAERVHIRRNVHLTEEDALPCALVGHYGIRPANNEGSSRENAVHYLILISLCWAGGREAINGEGLALNAMERIYIAFSKKPTRAMGFVVDANGAMCKQTTIDAADALNEEAWRRGLMVKFLIIDHLVRLPYGDVA